MTYERDGHTLTVHFQRDFNLLTARHLRQIVQDDDVDVTLYNPPELFREMISMLDLESVFAVKVAAS